MFDKAKLSTKIFFLGTIITLCFSISLIALSFLFKSNLFDYGKGNVKNVVGMAHTILSDYDVMVKNGILPLDKAQAEAMQRIRNLRYSGKEYFWINDMGPKMVMHPFKPELEGRDISDMKDADGKYYFIEMVNICKSKGEGYVEYYWPKPGMSNPVPKVSFVKSFESWGWIIGSGLYADDIQKDLMPIIYAIFTVILLISLLGLSISYVISRSLSKPINRIIASISDGADQVAAASAQVAAASQQLAAGSSEQASSLDRTSSSMESVSSMTKQNVDYANEAKKMMDEVGRTVEKVNVNMINMAEAMTNVTKSSEETGKIIKTIDEIAFQTNLLALNAAVEAARAGESGAGFAVVADEVRNLAMKAATAAKDTGRMIENTMKDITRGNELTKLTQDAFKENMEIASKVAAMVDEITAVSGKQYQNIEQVNGSVLEMTQITEQTAANAEESAAAAEEMNAQAEQLKSLVFDMTGLIDGNNGKVPDHVENITKQKRMGLVHHKAGLSIPIPYKGDLSKRIISNARMELNQEKAEEEFFADTRLNS